MKDHSIKWGRVGGPCGICGGSAIVLIATQMITSAEYLEGLAWYLLVSGVLYAGRLPIHVFGIPYVSLHPSRTESPELRRRLNFLTCMNAVSALVWLVAAVFLLSNPAVPIALESAFGIVFYALVMWLGMETVGCATSLGLPRGTEWVCDSPVGKRFKELRQRAPDETPIRDSMDIFTRKTPPYQASWFLSIVAGALLALPSGSGAAQTTEKALDVVAGISQSTVVTKGPSADGAGDSVVEPSYEEECGGEVEPGEPAPSPRREQLRFLWLGGEGVEGAGAIEGGCAHRAAPALGHPEVWIARGYCGSDLRSLGVVAPNYLPSLLFQQAARFALAKERAGELRGASSRWEVGEGDGYVVDTDTGSFVLAREDASGEAERSEGDLPCERFDEANVPYVVVPPGLIGLWLQVGEDGWVWPKRDPADSDGFLLVGEGGRTVRAHCYSDTRCAAWIDGVLTPTTGSLFTSVSLLLNMTG